jgi:hypothetical protein
MRWLLIVDFREGGRETFQMAERRIVDDFLAAYNGSWWFQEISIVLDRVVRKLQIANFQVEPAPPDNESGAMVPASSGPQPSLSAGAMAVPEPERDPNMDARGHLPGAGQA